MTMGANGDDTPPHGVVPTLKVLAGKSARHDADISDLFAGVERVENMLSLQGGDMARLEKKVDDLSTDVRHAMRVATTPPPPPMRPESASVVDFRELGERAVVAVREGIESPTKTPEDEIRRLFAEEAERREGAKAVQAINDRKKSVRRWAETVLGGLSVAGLAELVKYIATHH
ncbi:MAG TPA: hypothetical protein VGJ79_08900 [Candidatus Dormibacteraeota bacterium]|jgi:hypothetical protein